MAWTKADQNRRVFFTTLGHPEDFRNDDFRRMVVNGLLWTLNLPIPAAGAKSSFPAPYTPPPSGFPK